MDWIASGGIDLTMYRNTANLLKEGGILGDVE